MVKFLNWFDISLPEFMDNQYGEFIILLGLWLLIGLIAVLVMRPIIRRLFARTKSHLDDKVLHILEGPIIMLVFFYGIVVSLNVLDDIPPDIRHGLQVLYQVVVSLVVVYLVYKVFRAVFVPLGTDYAKRKESSIDKTLLPVVDTIGGTIIILVGLFWVLGNLGVDVTVFLAGIGVAGLVLAFALQDTLSNYFSGLHLMLDRPFDIGDTLEIEAEFLEVRQIGFRSTRLWNIYADEIVIMPNNMIANLKITNLTKPGLEVRIKVHVGVAYGSPVEMVKEILLEAVTAQGDDVIQDDPKKNIYVRFNDFGDSALMFSVSFYIKDVFEQFRISTAVREHIDRRFREEGVTIPFPQRTVSFLGQKEGQDLRVQGEPVDARSASAASMS